MAGVAVHGRMAGKMDDWLKFVVGGLAVFRLGLMLSDDTGPWRFISKFRGWLKREEKKSPSLKRSDVAKGVECIRCSGIWMAMLITGFYYSRSGLFPWIAATGDAVILCFALAGAGVLFNRMFPPR